MPIIGRGVVKPRVLYKSFRFNVQIRKKASDQNNMIDASFASIKGFESSYEVVEFRTGIDDKINKRKYAGLAKYGNAILTRGVSSNIDFYNWIASGFEKENLEMAEVVTINLLDDTGKNVVASWELQEVWPIKYVGPDLDAKKSDVAIEELELAYNGIKRLVVTEQE